jgi:hypothetical protein
MSDQSDADYGLILGFDSDDEEFCRGFEAGRLYEQMKDGEPFTQMIHASNTEMAMRICETAERGFKAESVDAEWTDLVVAGREPV